MSLRGGEATVDHLQQLRVHPRSLSLRLVGQPNHPPVASRYGNPELHRDSVLYAK